MSSTKIESITNLVTIIVELSCDSSDNSFIVNDPKLLRNLTPCVDTVSVTSRSTSVVSCKVMLCLLSQGDQSNLVTDVKNVPCTTSNPHNGFPALPSCGHGFKKAMHSTRESIALKDDKNIKFELTITSQHNGLDCVDFYFVKP